MIAAFAALGLSACMNLEPIDPNVVQMNSENQQQIINLLYNKLYVAFIQTGQTGGGGDADIITDDEGYSGFFRTMCVLNEFPTDAGWWTWRNDAGCSDLLMMSWVPANPFVSKLYNRLNYAVTMANHYLDLTEGATDREAQARRAEVRFIRAYNYYCLLDMFGNVPFTVTISTANPEQIDRVSLYNWLVDELTTGHSGKTYNNKKTGKALESYKVTDDAKHGLIDDLYDKGETTIYRANKTAAKMLLARLYLNAGVYTGTPEWTKAEEVAKELMAAYPTLHKPYAEIFMGDNDKAAPEEMIFLAACDGGANGIRAYAGAQYVISSTRNNNMNYCGTGDNNWGCWRSSPELIKVFFPGKTPAEIVALGGDKDEFDMPAVAGDDRAMFSARNDYTDATTGAPAVNQKSFVGEAPASGEGFDNCWGICKWTNMYASEFEVVGGYLHPKARPADYINPQHDGFWCDADIPLMRASEAYMTYAEALYRQGKTGEALTVVNQVRARANAAALTALTDDELLDEWLREFYHEGRRRIDMIRFGQFAGPTVTRTWEGRSGNSQKAHLSFTSPSAWSTDVVSIDAKYNLYPIPHTDVVSNPNMVQNAGYEQ